ncbi:MAG: CBS domain-containing protein [Nitrospirota bacterium]|nr:CBS domain-containing protein [Nitrospirota bacterium]
MGMMRVRDVMSDDPVSVPPGTDLVDAARLMRRMGIRSLLVREEHSEPPRYVGIVTGTDLAGRVLAEEPHAPVTVGEIMTFPLLTIDYNEPLRRANEEMVRHHVRHLVVTRGGAPVAIISARDLLLPEEEVEGAIPFWPHHLLKEVVAALLVIAIMLVFVWLSPAPMLEQADPFVTPEHIKPEWYFLAAYQFLKFAEVFRFLGGWAPKMLGVGLMGIVPVLLVFFPFFDPGPERNPRKRPVAISFGIACTVMFIAFTLWGHFS